MPFWKFCCLESFAAVRDVTCCHGVMCLCPQGLPEPPSSHILGRWCWRRWDLGPGTSSWLWFCRGHIRFPELVGGSLFGVPLVGLWVSPEQPEGRDGGCQCCEKASAVGELGPEGRTVLCQAVCVLRDSCCNMFSYFYFICGGNYVLCGISIFWFSQRKEGLCL